jgi:hypothetical protein
LEQIYSIPKNDVNKTFEFITPKKIEKIDFYQWNIFSNDNI